MPLKFEREAGAAQDAAVRSFFNKPPEELVDSEKAVWEGETRSVGFQTMTIASPPKRELLVKDRDYFNGDQIGPNRDPFEATMKATLDAWAREQESAREMSDWKAEQSRAVDMLAQREFSQTRLRERKIERMKLEANSGAYFVRESDQVRARACMHSAVVFACCRCAKAARGWRSCCKLTRPLALAGAGRHDGRARAGWRGGRRRDRGAAGHAGHRRAAR